MPEVTPNSNHQFRLADSLLGAQMLFVAFGALALVPLTGLDSNVALFTGAGTLIFQVITQGKVPVFLASSFGTKFSAGSFAIGKNHFAGLPCPVTVSCIEYKKIIYADRAASYRR